LFPRTVSTAATRNKQKPVTDKEHVMSFFQGALREDCRISAFGIGQTNPDLIFIDLDLKDFNGNQRALKSALTKILKSIEKKIAGAPTVIWSGRGYHVIQPIRCPDNLDDRKEFVDLLLYHDRNVNKAFLQFASRYLSGNKRDKKNHASLESCLLRVPGSINSRAKTEGKKEESRVKVIQCWDGRRPDYRLLIGRFHADLVTDVYEKKKKQDMVIVTPSSSSSFTGVVPISYAYIQNLLDKQIPIDDGRKYTVNVIIIPYLMIIKGIRDVNTILSLTMNWLDKCDQLRRLQPSKRDFENRIRYRRNEIINSGKDAIPPIKEETLKREHPDLYENLKSGDVR
jgi:hypothetical protein